MDYCLIMLHSLIFLIVTSSFSRGHLFITDEEYTLLPPIYKIMSHDECPKNIDNIFCTADVKLKPLNKSSQIWKLIEETKRDDFFYNHDAIYRTICMPKMYRNNSRAFVGNIVNNELQRVNLTSTIEKISCKETHHPTVLDHILWEIVVAYLCLIASATFYDSMARRKGLPTKDNILTAFSLRCNYEKIFHISKSSNYQNLKCIQGLRTLTCILVIWTHTKTSFVMSFVEDTKYVEDMYYKVFYIHFIFDFFLTQAFSLISAWLLTVQVLTIFETNKKFTIWDGFIIFANRIFRLLPTMVGFIIYFRKSNIDTITTGTLSDVSDVTIRGCEMYWWHSLLFIQNNFMAKDVCNEGFWYISTDVQLYALCLTLLYIVLKLKATKTILGMSLLLSYGLFGLLIYLKELDVVFRPYPETFKWFNLIKDTNMLYLYKMPYVSMSTYIIGICFGIYYYQHRKVTSKNISPIIWIATFIGLPALAIVIASKEFSGLSASFIGPLLKPMYSFGIGMGILGMCYNKHGIIKNIFEWRPLEFLSQFTYSTYIFHFMMVYFRTVMHKPLAVSNYILITSGMVDVILGFTIGFVVYLLVELPWSNVQKMFLPQVRRNAGKTD